MELKTNQGPAQAWIRCYDLSLPLQQDCTEWTECRFQFKKDKSENRTEVFPFVKKSDRSLLTEFDKNKNIWQYRISKPDIVLENYSLNPTAASHQLNLTELVKVIWKNGNRRYSLNNFMFNFKQ